MKLKQTNYDPVDHEFLMECSREFNIVPLVMEQIIARGNNTKEKIKAYLNPSAKQFYNPFLLKGVKEFCQRVKQAKEKNEKILVFGDYDVDGISATAIMVKCLKMYGITANWYLPNRYIDGYGLTNDVILKIKEKYNPDLIITVDCGISCHDEVEFAKSLGIEIIVTDHHEIPENIPECIVINAKLPNQDYPFSQLCGTGLAYKIANALLGKNIEEFLCIACIATIADIVPLIDENRAIVHFGLKNFNYLPTGLKVLFKKLKIKLVGCSANEISYKIAPKINASGRMGSAEVSLKLYFSENLTEINSLIKQIITFNEDRKLLCLVVEKDCQEILAKLPAAAPSIILSSKTWDQGILGIICAKLSGQYHRPVFLFSEKDGILKGSARSIKGINIHELLSTMSDILESYGGHPIAAGLTLKAENFNEFVMRVNRYLQEKVDPEAFVPVEYYDVKIKPEDVNFRLLKDLRQLEPCGHQNETLKFMFETDKFQLVPMAKFPIHCNILPNSIVDLVYFNFVEDYNKLLSAKTIRTVFEFQVSSYRAIYKGTIKTVDYDLDESKMFDIHTLPYYEQIKYINYNNKPAKYNIYSLSENKTYELDSSFGTAFVVNSAFGYKIFKEKVDATKVINLDLGNGTKKTGENCLFVCPENLSFARNYQKIIFLDAVADASYLAYINSISDAKIYVPNLKVPPYYYQRLNLSRDNFGTIYKDLFRVKKHFYNFLELYQNIKKVRNVPYSYKEFYCAILVFIELGFIEHNVQDFVHTIKFKKQKNNLNNSKILKKLNEINKKGVK